MLLDYLCFSSYFQFFYMKETRANTENQSVENDTASSGNCWLTFMFYPNNFALLVDHSIFSV